MQKGIKLSHDLAESLRSFVVGELGYYIKDIEDGFKEEERESMADGDFSVDYEEERDRYFKDYTLPLIHFITELFDADEVYIKPSELFAVHAFIDDQLLRCIRHDKDLDNMIFVRNLADISVQCIRQHTANTKDDQSE